MMTGFNEKLSEELMLCFLVLLHVLHGIFQSNIRGLKVAGETLMPLLSLHTFSVIFVIGLFLVFPIDPLE
jgi:hypothetical protein